MDLSKSFSLRELKGLALYLHNNELCKDILSIIIRLTSKTSCRMTVHHCTLLKLAELIKKTGKKKEKGGRSKIREWKSGSPPAIIILQALKVMVDSR